jgi:tRNA uracil 4-sulfurtransferase
MKAIALLSSGIDSPVSIYILSSYMDEIVFMHADGRPYTDNKEIENFKVLANHLRKKVSCKTKTCMVPHGKSIESYKNSKSHPRYCCVFCKRMMVRYANSLANHIGAEVIIMGDSLGQVASQTLANIQVVDSVSVIPILRPLIGFDKEEIVQISKDIGTYDLSIKETIGCTAVPEKPATKSDVSTLEANEKNIHINDLIQYAISNIDYIV